MKSEMKSKLGHICDLYIYIYIYKYVMILVVYGRRKRKEREEWVRGSNQKQTR